MNIQETLEDVRHKLVERAYSNEEHVRIGIVLRLLRDLGWNIWNPHEVYTEFQAIPNEDKGRVDVALFVLPISPSVFIEAKSVGKLQGDIKPYETQARDYNRNNTATFTVITDGQRWRFYYSLASGEFSQKCFERVDLLEDDLERLSTVLYTFLSKSEIAYNTAKKNAESYLQFTQKQRLMEDVLPQARKSASEPPFPNLPQALVNTVAQKGLTISIEEATQFATSIAQRPIPPLSDNYETTATEEDSNDGVRIPEALSEVLEVCYEVYENNLDYTDATKKVAKRRRLKSPNTVADKCTRQLGLNTNEFRQLLNNKSRLAAHLSERYPKNATQIRKALQ